MASPPFFVRFLGGWYAALVREHTLNGRTIFVQGMCITIEHQRFVVLHVWPHSEIDGRAFPKSVAAIRRFRWPTRAEICTHFANLRKLTVTGKQGYYDGARCPLGSTHWKGDNVDMDSIEVEISTVKRTLFQALENSGQLDSIRRFSKTHYATG
jgi:hypothetical protein